MKAESHLTAHIAPDRVAHNLGQIRNHIGPGVKLCAVVKANAYGHGLADIIDAVTGGSDMLAVATCEEALDARRLGYEGSILVFLPTAAAHDREQLIQTIQSDITMAVTSLHDLERITDAAHAADRSAQVHINIDSGMNRLGVALHDAAALIDTACHGPNIALCGLFTHFACVDESDKTPTHKQLRRFLEIAEPFRSTDVILHAANSAATIDLPETHLDMVRCGISIYGYAPSDTMANRLDLRPALRITTPIMQIKTVAKGERSGYGLTHIFGRDSRVAAVRMGYADGFPRSLSSQAVLRVDGQPAPVVGRVSMDQLTIDVTDVPSAAVGSEVEVVADDPDAPNSIENLARQADTIPYELTCRLNSPRIKHVLV